MRSFQLLLSAYLAYASPAWAQSTVDAALVSAFSSGLSFSSLEDVDFVALENARQGSLEAIPVESGEPCLEVSSSESYHRVSFMVEASGKAYRRVFSFTLEPAWPGPGPAMNLAELFESRVVTQYHAWQETPEGASAGEVVGFRSRASVDSCAEL